MIHSAVDMFVFRILFCSAFSTWLLSTRVHAPLSQNAHPRVIACSCALAEYACPACKPEALHLCMAACLYTSCARLHSGTDVILHAYKHGFVYMVSQERGSNPYLTPKILEFLGCLTHKCVRLRNAVLRSESNDSSFARHKSG